MAANGSDKEHPEGLGERERENWEEWEQTEKGRDRGGVKGYYKRR